MTVLANLGTAGSALDAQLGSTSGADSNDPVVLNGLTKFVFVPSGNSVTIPDPSWVAGAVELDVRCALALDDWTPAAIPVAVAHGSSSAAANHAFRFYPDTTSKLNLSVSNGSTASLVTSTVAPSAADGELLLGRAKWRGSDGKVQFLTKTSTEATAFTDLVSNSGWTPLGGDRTTVGVAALNDLAVAMTAVGALSGRCYGTWVSTTIDGPANLAIDFTANSNQSSFVCSTGQTVTINRATGVAQKTAVYVGQPTLLFGGDDYLEVSDDSGLAVDGSASATFGLTVRQFATLAAGQTLAAKRAGVTAADVGWSVQGQSASTYRVSLSDGTNVVTADSPAITLGALTDLTWVLNRSTGFLTVYANGVAGVPAAIGSLGSITNTDKLRIGRLSGAGTAYGAFQSRSPGRFWQRALSAAEVAAVAARYTA